VDILDHGIAFGKYTLVRQIGVGGMAQVYVASKLMGEIAKMIALKVSSDFVGYDPQKREGILNEIRIGGRMRHPNIVSVLDAGEYGGVLFIELELIDGQDLRQFLEDRWRSEQPLPFGVVSLIVRGILEGLHYAHADFTIDGVSQRVIHRDLTPSNVIVSTAGEVKMFDFGISKYFDEHTSGAYLKGKPRYMAPEYACGTSAPSVDLFGAGAILYELIEGRRFRDDVPKADLYATAVSGTTPRLTRADTPAPFVQLYDALVAADVKRRVHSAAAAMAILDLWEGRPALASELRAIVRLHTGGTRSGYTRREFAVPEGLEVAVAVANARAQATGAAPPRAAAARGRPEPTVDSPRRAARDAALDGHHDTPRVASVVVTPAPATAAANDLESTAIEPRPPAAQAAVPVGIAASPVHEPTVLLPPPEFTRQPVRGEPSFVVPPALLDPAGALVVRPAAAWPSEPTADRPRAESPGTEGTAFVVARGGIRGWHVAGAAAGVLAMAAAVGLVLIRGPQGSGEDTKTAPVTEAAARAPASIELDAAPVQSDAPSRAGPKLEPSPVSAPTPSPAPMPTSTPAPGPAPTPASVPPAADPAPPAAATSSPTAEQPVAPNAPAAPEKARKPKPATPPKPKVKVRIIPMLGKGELQIGKKVHMVGATSYDLMLTVGKHAMKWRNEGESAWIDRPTLVLTTGNDYLLHVAAKGTKLTPTPKETP
jgi:serine/threonine protein kinase